MRLESVLHELKPVRGVTSVLAAVIGGGDMRSVSGAPATDAITLEQAEAKHAQYKKLMDECRSDAAYWGYLGSVEYWQMVVNVLKAAALVGADNLPDVPLPPRDGMVMDLCAKQSKFGKDVLRLAQEQATKVVAVDPQAGNSSD